MNKTTLFLSGVVMCMGAATAWAADEQTSEEVTRVTLTLTSGQEEHYLLADTPEITLSGDDLVIASDQAQATHPRAEVDHISFTKGPKSSLDLTAAPAQYAVSYLGSALIISGKDLTSSTACSTAGQVMATAQADTQGTIALDLTGLAAGVYVVTVEGHPSIKIFKKN